jgi:hypothetical protein
MTTTVTIGVIPINATYTGITGATGGSGVGAKFDVIKTNGVYSTTVESTNLGTGYALGDTITIPGTSIGGAAPANNDVIIVTGIGTNGAVKTFATAGVGAVGNGIINTTINVTPDVAATTNTYTLTDKSANYTVVNDYADNILKVTSALDTLVSFNLNNYQRINYTDKSTAFDLNGHAGDVYALLKAGFGSTIVTNNAPLNTLTFNTFEGLGIKMEDAGQTSTQIAQAIASSSVFSSLAGGSDYASFVNFVYTNVIGTAPTPAQSLPFITQLTTGATTEAALLASAAHLTTFQQTIGLVGIAPATTGVLSTSGIDFIPA